MSAKKYAKSLIKRYSHKYAKKHLKQLVIDHIKSLMKLCKEAYERYYFYNCALQYAKRKL